jgi:hypothetical protein
MITGMTLNNQTELQKVLEVFNKSTYQFQLTGSRFFGTNREDSDWDFFTEVPKVLYPTSVFDFLEDNGFYTRFNNHYDQDISFVSVYEHSCGIHVQIVKDFEQKKAAQELLYKTPGARVALRDKEIAKILWTMAILFVKENRPVKPTTASYLFSEDALGVIRQVVNDWKGNLILNKIQAIKMHRLMTGSRLKEAKDAVETLPMYKV